MQSITYENYADGYFQLFRGGAEIVNNTIKGFCPYGRLKTQNPIIYDEYNKVKGLYIRPHLPGETVYENRKNGWKYMLKVFLGFDDEQIYDILNTYDKKVVGSVPLKCCFTDTGEIVLWNPEKTKDPVPVSRICKTNCKFLKEWGKPLLFYSLKEKYPDGIPVRGWKFERDAEYVICDSFHGPVEDYKDFLIPELFTGKLLKVFNNQNSQYIMSGERFRDLCTELYNLGPIDLSKSWDYTDEEKEQLRKEAEEKARKEQEAKEELERRKNTAGFCHLCGADHAEWNPFEGMYMCSDCYNDMFY